MHNFLIKTVKYVLQEKLNNSLQQSIRGDFMDVLLQVFQTNFIQNLDLQVCRDGEKPENITVPRALKVNMDSCLT